jgi:hypothetical protein
LRNNRSSEIAALTDAIVRLQYLLAGQHEQRRHLLEALPTLSCFAKEQWFRL